jgi:peptidoglycan/LPS O-acetylase OafA/YrhL
MNRRASIQYQPALDGVRAVAVVLVLLFHLGLPWLPAGYLGVSVFFTLSGFLITSLLLAEHSTNNAVDFRQFYSRRARRLLPASLLVLLLVVVARWMGEFRYVPGLRPDLIGALLQVFNWVQLAGTISYGQLFGSAPAFVSPLEHYWSLAVEEQFYLLWPIALVLLCRRARRSGRRVTPLVLAVTSVFVVAAPLIGWWWGPDAAYWATPSRLGELLVGASLAAWLHEGARVRFRARVLAPLALGVIVVCSAVFPSGSGPAFTGWLAPFAFVSAALIVGLQKPSRVRTMLSARPVVALGRVSYGLYLFHWPVFVLMRQHGWNLTNWWGATLALAISLGVTVVSYLLLERRVRLAALAPRVTAIGAALATAAVLGAMLVVPVQRGFLEADTATLEAASIDTGLPVEPLTRATTTTEAPATGPSASTGPSSTGPSSSEPISSEPITSEPISSDAATTTTLGEVVLPLPAVPNRPVRILVVGDSTAFYVGQGMAAWAVANPQHAQASLLWCQGCGFILDGAITSFDAAPFVETSRRVVLTDLPQTIQRVHPDVVVLMTTIDDVADRAWDMAEGTLTPRDPRFRERMRTQYASLTASVLAAGASGVVWVVPPVPTSYFDTADLGEHDRYRIQHDVIREVAADAAASGGSVVVCDVDRWMTQAGHDTDTAWRPDGTHLNEESARWLADRWLGPWLVNAATGAATTVAP